MGGRATGRIERLTSRNGGGLLVMSLLVALGVCGCRAAAPTGETPLHLSRVYNGPPLSRTSSTFVSRGANLGPIERSMRSSLFFGGNLGEPGFAWDFAGNTEDYNPLLSGPLSHVGPIDHGPRVPIGIGSYAELQNELCGLSADPNLARLLGNVTLPTLPSLAGAEDVRLRFAFEDSTVSWGTSTIRTAATLSLPAGTVVPALRIALPVEVRDIELPVLADFLFDVGPYTLPLSIDIGLQPCGDCTNPAVTCTDAPGSVAVGYRSSIATSLGYAASDVDVVYPDMGLNFVVETTPPPPPCDPVTRRCEQLPGVTGGTSFTAACPFAIGDLNTEALIANLNLDRRRLEPVFAFLIDIGRGLLAPLRYLLGLIACEILTDVVDDEVRRGVGPVPSSLRSVFDLLANPPVLNRTLGGLGPGLVPSLPAGSVADRAIAGVVLTAGPYGAVPTVAATTATGAYTDALFNVLASGGCATNTTNVNMLPVNNACIANVGLGPLDAVACAACTAGGRCDPAALPTPTCAFACAGTTFANTLITIAGPPGPPVPTCPPASCAQPSWCRAGVPIPGVPVPPTQCAGAAYEIAPAPNLANLITAAPLFSETIRRWFATPLPAGARYSSVVVGPTPGTVAFSYINDPDDDCVPEETDVCPGVFDPAQLDDGDGDRYGFACDFCRGVADSSPDANADDDLDGIPNACDCDRDGDLCNQEGLALAGPCPPGPDGIFDRAPTRRGLDDFDGDAINDDCDNDRDEDLVLEEPFDGSAPDNCPLGNGDGIYQPGLIGDQNPDQTDSGGLSNGDLCDLTCPGPDAPSCDAPIEEEDDASGSGGFGPDDSSGVFGAIAGLRDCLGLGSGAGGVCEVTAFLQCPGADYDRCWRPDSFDSVILVGTLGQTITQIDAAQLGFVGGFASSSATVPDIDGDGREELVLAAPRTEVCPEGKACFGSPGVLAIFGSERGKLITRVMGPEDGSRFGTSMARLGDVLAVGAPFAAGGRGAVYLYRVDGESLQLLSVVAGDGINDRLGTNVAPAFGADTAAPSFLIGAPGARARAGQFLIANPSQGVTHRFDGPRPNGAMSLGVVTGTASSFTVIGGLPTADAGRGALAFFTGRRPARVRRGAPGARLGERVVVADGEVVASAPGVGAVIRYSSAGDPLGSTTSALPLFGIGLSSPGDLDGDGTADLFVGFGIDAAGSELLSVPLYRRVP